MPKILINEKDYTSPGTPGSYANYSVLIAGYQKEFTEAEVTEAETAIAAYELAVKNKQTPTPLSDTAKIIKARTARIDSNGVYEFSSKQDFEDTIGLVDIECKSEADPQITEKHYGNRMAYELLNLGYTIVYKPIKQVAELASEDFWKVFKDKASYDFRFISHGLLETNHDREEYNNIKTRIEELEADETRLNKIDLYVESLDAIKEATTEEAKTTLRNSLRNKEYLRIIAPEGVAAPTKDEEDNPIEPIYNGVGEGYKGFINPQSTQGDRYVSYTEARTATTGGLTTQRILKNEADEDYITADVFNNINSVIANLASYRQEVAEDSRGRGDCIALIELDEREYVQPGQNPENLIIEGINNMAGSIAKNGAYCAMTVPSVHYKMSGEVVKFPGAFHYLACFMNSLSSGFAEWYAAAGYTRGVASYVIDHASVKLGEIAINALEPRNLIDDENKVQPKFACNVIANFRGSYYLWGNRTAHELGSAAGGNDLVAHHFLNIRQLCTTIKKQLYVACRRFTFDPNSDTLWYNFVNAITPTLDAMKADQGVRDYKILKVFTDKKATLKAKIRIIPIEAVEDFDLEISLEDSFGETSAVVTE